jgi:hypothetical protein
MPWGGFRVGWIIAATCVFLSYAVWIRRSTLTDPSEQSKLGERSLTISLICQGSGLFLMTPQSSRTVDPVLHAVFRHWNIDVFIAHWLYVCAAAMIGVNVASRLNITPDQLRHHFRLAFGLPMTILVPITLALIVQSPDADRHWPDLFYSPVDYWLDAYWTLIAVFVIAILAGTIWALTLIRVDTRHRHATNIYIAACVAGIIVCMVRIATAWFDIDGGDDAPILLWLGECGYTTAFSYAAIRSWRQKQPVRL